MKNILLFLSLAMCGCAAPHGELINTKNIWPLNIGDTTVLQNAQTGALTTIQVQEPMTRFCASPDAKVVDVHFTKNDTTTYWNPGIASSLHFIIEVDPDQTIKAIGLIQDSENSGGNITLTDEVYPYNGQNPLPYVAFFPQIFDGEQYETPDNEALFYNEYISSCAFNDTALLATAGHSVAPAVWLSSWDIEDVQTPLYSGRAIVWTSAQGWYPTANGLAFCNGTNEWGYYEKWAFALDKSVGLVQISGLIEGSKADGSPPNSAADVCPLTTPLVIKAISYVTQRP